MEKFISLAHGDGGELSHQLICDVFIKAFGDNEAALFDAATLTIPAGKIAVTTDSFVIKPIFFPEVRLGN